MSVLDPRAEALEALVNGPLHRFADWHPELVPNGSIGTYTIWDLRERFLYIGVAGRGINAEAPDMTKRQGLRDRLHHHQNGRRSGDQFCVYVFDRLVLPTLTAEDIQRAASGREPRLCDDRVRTYVREQLGFRYALLPTYRDALAVEAEAKAHGLNGNPPLLNPAGLPDQ